MLLVALTVVRDEIIRALHSWNMFGLSKHISNKSDLLLEDSSDADHTPSLTRTQVEHLIARCVMCHRYNPFVVAETEMSAPPLGRKPGRSDNAPGSGAFDKLARYIFGGNDRQEKMKMTTPVLSDSSGKMRFIVSIADGVSSSFTYLFLLKLWKSGLTVRPSTLQANPIVL